MWSIFTSTYLSRKPIEKATLDFSQHFKEGQKVLDIGCGTKPYRKFFSCEYIGVDPLESVHPDITSPAWKIPAPDDSFDGIILNQSLEHIQKTEETIKEIKRLLKPGGICLVTVPQTMKNHSEPIPIEKSPYARNISRAELPFWQEDYYRFTKFALVYLFREFQIEKLRESNGYIGSILQLINYFFSSFGKARIIFTPLFFINNCLGHTADSFFAILSRSNIPIFRKFYVLIYSSLTLNYIVIVRRKS